MSWVKIDDRAPEHRKLIAAGPAACWLWVCGLAYCNRQSAADGFIPEPIVRCLYPMPRPEKEAARLVAAGLWEAVPGGYQIHDYHDFQPDSAEMTERREKRAAAGRAGGVASGRARRAKQTKQVASENEASCFVVRERFANPDPDPDPHPLNPPRPSPPVQVLGGGDQQRSSGGVVVAMGARLPARSAEPAHEPGAIGGLKFNGGTET